MAEFENLVSATRTGLRSGELHAAAQTARAAVEVLKARGPFHMAEALLFEVLETPGMETDESAGYLWNLLADTCRLRGKAAEGLPHLTKALAVFRARGDRRGEGIALANLGNVQRRLSQTALAQENYESALVIFRALEDRLREGIIVGNLASLLNEIGHPAQAQSLLNLSLSINREVGNRLAEGAMMGNLATLLLHQGHIEASLAHLESSLAIHRETGNQRMEGNALSNLGTFQRQQGDFDAAREYLEAALSIQRRLGNKRMEGVALGNIGDLLATMGDRAGSLQYFEHAVAICDESLPPAAGAFRGSMAVAAAQDGDFPKSRALLAKGEAQLRDVWAYELAKLLCKRATVEHLAGDVSAATDALVEAEALGETLGLGAESEVGTLLVETRAKIG